VESARPPAATEENALSQPQRPLWLVAALTVTTFGGYTPIWLGITWAEMKRTLRDEDMHPVWHALASLVPIYGLFKFFEHYTVIESLAAHAKHKMRVSAFAATVLAVFTTVPSGSNQPLSGGVALLVLLLWIAAAAVRAWVMVEGQAALNAYWRCVPNDNPRERVAWWEWVLLALGVIWFALIVFGLLAPE
jgi:hypothetical protein